MLYECKRVFRDYYRRPDQRIKLFYIRKKEDKMIEIKMTVDDVDYEEILETLYPLLEERLYNKIENPLLPW